MKMNKIACGLIVIFYVVCSFPQTKLHILTGLKSSNWDSITTVVTELSNNENDFKKDPEIRNTLLSLFHSITDRYRHPEHSRLQKIGDSGEIEGDIAFLIIKFDIKEAIPDLLDWAGNGVKIRKYIVSTYIKNGCTDSAFLDTLSKKFDMTEDYYISRRNEYFYVARSIVDSIKVNCIGLTMLMKKILLIQFKSNDYNSRMNAVDYSKHYVDDSLIYKQLQFIAQNDPYFETGASNIKKYSIRDMAIKIIHNKR
ncbi:MAG TPA: hypothetical protein DCO75_06775 [Fibrobacteres bacterium]|jgi:hypothetical protein|nr:hypothetical protein [Fibrobacterota bacterium]